MDVDTIQSSKIRRPVAFVSAFVGLPLFNVAWTFVARGHNVFLFTYLYLTTFVVVPFIVFLLLAERFQFFAKQRMLQHATCILVALVSTGLCFFVETLGMALLAGGFGASL